MTAQRSNLKNEDAKLGQLWLDVLLIVGKFPGSVHVVQLLPIGADDEPTIVIRFYEY